MKGASSSKPSGKKEDDIPQAVHRSWSCSQRLHRTGVRGHIKNSGPYPKVNRKALRAGGWWN